MSVDGVVTKIFRISYEKSGWQWGDTHTPEQLVSKIEDSAREKLSEWQRTHRGSVVEVFIENSDRELVSKVNWD